MKITYTFSNTFSDLFLGKCYRFAQRSASRYAMAAAMLTLGLHFGDKNLSWVAWVSYGLGYFALLCVAVIAVYALIAYQQTKQAKHSLVSFCDSKIIFEAREKSNNKSDSWRIITTHALHSRLIVFSFNSAPEQLLFIQKRRLNSDDFKQLSQWFIRCRKSTLIPSNEKKK